MIRIPRPKDILTPEFFPRFIRHVLFNLIKVDHTLRLRPIGGQYHLSVARKPQSAASGGGSGDTYNGPWKIEQKPDTDNIVQVTESYFYTTYNPNRVVMGAAEYEYEGEEEWEITETCVLYYFAMNTDGVITHNFDVDTDLPGQTETEFYVPLAYITFSDGKITEIRQFHYGQIYIAGRVI